MRRFSFAGALALVAAQAPLGCGDSAPPPRATPVLILGEAADQPASSELGVLITIQSRGGTHLSIRARGGTVASTTAAAGFTEAQCIPLDPDAKKRLQLIDVLLRPDDVEAILQVDLLDGVMEDDAGLDLADACPPGHLAKSEARSFTTERKNTASPGPSADAGAATDGEDGEDDASSEDTHDGGVLDGGSTGDAGSSPGGDGGEEVGDAG